MKFARFFIDRPIFAAVLSLLITVAGALSLLRLPISEYPSVVPPTVVVRGTYPGANPKVIAETVAAPLEQQINGVENMLYMFSQATADGRMTLTVTFALGTDLDNAQVQVQNRVAQALPRLPAGSAAHRRDDREGVARPHDGRCTWSRPTTATTCSTCRTYAYLQVKDELAQIAGVGDVHIFGAGEYSMRVWLDPDKLAARELTATDVVRAIREQNVQVAAGVLGAPPAPTDTTLPAARSTRRAASPREEEFGDIVVRATPDGQITRVRDVGARRARRQPVRAAQPARQQAGRGHRHLAAARLERASQASDDVRALLERLKQSFPEGVDYQIVYDPTVYVRESINAVVETLFEAILLVVLVVLVFLQTWRASIIPLVAVPVSLVGTFADHARVRLLAEHAVAVRPRARHRHRRRRRDRRGGERGAAHRARALAGAATHKAMEEVSGPIIAIALVLCAVFVPTAFVSGLTGQFYRQFALTIAISTVISAFNSLTLSPALASRLLRPHGAPRDRVQRGLDFVVRPVLPCVQPVLRAALGALRQAASRGCCASVAAVALSSTAACWR